MSSPLISGKYGSFFSVAREHQVIFYYVGYFSQTIIAAMADAVKLQLEVAGVAGRGHAPGTGPRVRWTHACSNSGCSAGESDASGCCSRSARRCT